MNGEQEKMGTSYLIGVDGGGSKTLALAADLQGNILGRGTAGPSNHLSVGFEAACQAIEQAIQSALEEAGFAPQADLRAICLGLGGVGRPAEAALFQGWANQRFPGIPARVVTDAHLALAAGTPQGWGVCLICGTGSIAYGRDPSGREARAGGWGYLFGDEGSGYAIGAAALRAVSQAADGRLEPTRLTQAVLEAWGLQEPQQIIPRAYNAPSPRADIAHLAKIVEQAAKLGDAQAQSILRQAGMELARLVQAAAAQLELEGPFPLALAGGVIVHDDYLFQCFIEAGGQLGLRFSEINKVTEAAQGAIRIARQLFQRGPEAL